MLTARHYQTGQPVRVEMAEGRYTSLSPTDGDDGLWIAPGLVDVQVNGFAGVDFNAPGLNNEAWTAATDALFAAGCTHFLATLLTNADDALRARLQALEACRQTKARNAIGYHLEGPFLNPDPGSRGCHPVDYMRAPDLAWLGSMRDAGGHAVRLITLAPEVHPAEAIAFISKATSSDDGIRIAVGHSLAMGDALEAAVQAGATGWTHLGNASPHEVAKFENVLLHTIAADGLRAVSMIPDGIHVPAHAFRALARALGPRLILTTDAMAGAAASPGRYTLGPVEAEVSTTGRATVVGSEGKLAGSTLTPLDGVGLAATMAGVPWQEMWDAFSVRPAAWLGLTHGLGIGLPASFCLLRIEDDVPRLEACWHNGHQVFLS